MILIIIILTLFVTSSPLQAQEFTMFQNNPVLKKDSKSAGVSQPSVLKSDNQFSAWFTDSVGGRATIGTMKSTNGVDWYDKKTLQLPSRNSVSDPFMFKSNNEYQLYFASSDSVNTSLWKSTSADGITFLEENGKEILKSEATWEGSRVSCPSIVQSNSLFYLFYAGNGGSNGWAIGMATSSDGQSWHKCENNPIVSVGSQSQIVQYNNSFYLYYQNFFGLQVQKTDALNGCNTVWSDPYSISPPFGDPSPIVVENDVWLYGNYGSDIGLAGTSFIPQPTYPIVIIPGMFASWNKNAILHNTAVSFDDWNLNPAVKEYNALKNTLTNIGQIENVDYFLFPYDWRKPIEETTTALDLFLAKKIWNSNPYKPIQIVGHSLGGVVSRIYADKNPAKPIKQVITVGSPNLGAVQTYKPLAGGEIDRQNTLMWIAEKLILLLNKSSLQSDKDTISQKFPVLFDVLPSFSFLKNENGAPVISTFSNTLLSRYPIISSPSIPQLYFGGSGIQTLGGYTLGSRTPLDILFGMYEEGRPLSSWDEDGDGVVLTNSSLNQIVPAPIQNHGGIIYSKESIKTILSKLNIQVQDSDIPQGEGTSIFPAILTFIQSPATMQITHNGKTTAENEGMIYLQNTENGLYSLRVAGQSEGEYTVSIWLIGEDDDKWIQFKKQTIIGKTDEYTIAFNSATGGEVTEYVAPTSTPTPLPTVTPKPTIKPTIKPTLKPTCKPMPTKKPTPTQKPHKHGDEDKKRKDYIKLIKSILDKLLKMLKKEH